MKYNFKGQSSLELTAVFVALLLLLLGMLRIWFWGNNDLLRRQRSYISSRSRDGNLPSHTTIPLSDGVIFRGGN